jgi:hypothetical protein
VPLDKLELCRIAQAIVGLSNVQTSNEMIVAWSLKKSDSDQPPIVLEEAIVLFERLESGTNRWMLVLMERNLARGRPGGDVWRPGPSADGMLWRQSQTDRPSSQDVVEFLRRCDFGANECRPFYKPIYIATYSSFKYLSTELSKGIPEADKRCRRLTLTGVMH